MTPAECGKLLAANVRAARARARLSQAATAERMQALGFTNWYAQTMGQIEREERQLLASEVHGLAMVLETSTGSLMSLSL